MVLNWRRPGQRIFTFSLKKPTFQSLQLELTVLEIQFHKCLIMLNLKIEEEGTKKRETDFSQWYLGQQEAQTETHEIPFKCKKNWPNTVTGCPERLWSPSPWTYSEPDQSWSRATCCSDPSLEEGLGLDDLQKSLTNSAILGLRVLWNIFEIQPEINHS